MSLLDRFSPAARRSLVRAAVLAHRAGQPSIDTDALLVSLADGSEVSAVLGRLGATDIAVREVVMRRWGWDPGPDDTRLLAALGIDVDHVRRQLPPGSETAGWCLERTGLRRRLCLAGPMSRLPLSRPARDVIDVALDRGRRYGVSPGDADLLHALLCDSNSRSVQVLSLLRVCFASLTDHLDARPAIAA